MSIQNKYVILTIQKVLQLIAINGKLNCKNEVKLFRIWSVY